MFPRLSERPLAARGGLREVEGELALVGSRSVPASLGAPPGGEGGLREVEGELAFVGGRGEAFPRLSGRPLAARGDYERWKESQPSLAAVARRSRVSRSAPWGRGGTTRGGRRAGPRWRPWRGVPASPPRSSSPAASSS